MKTFAYLGIVAWLASCAPREPAGEEKGLNKPGNQPAAQTNIGDVTWKFESEEVALGQFFQVRVDIPGEFLQQLNFSLDRCGHEEEGYFLMGSDGGDEPNIDTVHGTVGGLVTLTILEGEGRTAIPTGPCTVRATVVDRKTGEKGKTFIHDLQLQAGTVTLNESFGNLFTDLPDGRVSGKISVSENFERAHVSIGVCKVNGSHCESIGTTSFQPMPGDGVINRAELKYKDERCQLPPDLESVLDGNGSYLSEGEYMTLVLYSSEKPDFFLRAAATRRIFRSSRGN